MSTAVSSKAEILQVCKELISENGLPALNMRTIAQKCNIALGSLYNYFPSKNELTIAAIESVWQDIFHMAVSCKAEVSFSDYVKWIFESVNAGMVSYPNFFTAHSVSFASDEKGRARQTMQRYFVHIKSGLLDALEHDTAVRSDAFDEAFTASEFVDFIVESILLLLMQRKSSCSVLIKMVCSTLY
ncbi:MAG: TetR/AcrR family transcriptional regulator [Hydrogenoanaerobacterium sp.]